MAIASQAALQRPAGHRNNLAGDAGDGWRGKVDYGTGDIFALGSAVIAGTGNFSQTGTLGNLIGRLSPALHALTKWLWGRVLGNHIREAAQSWSIHSKDNL